MIRFLVAAVRLRRLLPGLLAGALMAWVSAAPASAIVIMQQCEEGKPADRIAACDALLARTDLDDATRARALIGRGYAVLFQSRDRETALANFTEATKLDPKNAEAFIGLGKMHYFDRRIDKAIAAFTTATELAPDNPVTWNNLGKVYYIREEYAEALKLFEKAVEVGPRHANSHLNYADTLYQLGRKEEALAEFRMTANFFEQGDNRLEHVLLMIDTIETELAAK